MLISIHALREEGDDSRYFRQLQSGYFYPRPPRGGRHELRLIGGCCFLFLSTPSARRATHIASPINRTCKFLSTPSARRATKNLQRAARNRAISIHALREEGDLPYLCFLLSLQISIHALREEGDPLCCAPATPKRRFLSTPSARRATGHRCRHHHVRHYFYPRPPRGGRRMLQRNERGKQAHFYPRPPRGGRQLQPLQDHTQRYFYPRPPRGGRPLRSGKLSTLRTISIHALREEGDSGIVRP